MCQHDDDDDDDDVVTIPPDIKDEILYACPLLPLAEGHFRWPISCEISCTDATPSTGGAVRACVHPDVAESMFRATEYTGSYMRLDSIPGLTPDTAEAPEDPILEDI
eukprot:2187686-Karenia_brevis.AAC.1